MTPAARAGRQAGRGPVTHPPRGGALLTTPEVAAELRVSIDTLKRWRRAGDGPRFVRVGRGVRYRRADLDAYLAG